MIGSEETPKKDKTPPTNKTVDRLKLKMRTHHPLTREKYGSQPSLASLNRTMPSVVPRMDTTKSNDNAMMVTSRSTPDLRALSDMQAKSQARKSIQDLTLSEAKEKLFTHKHSGVVKKRGFGGWRKWVDRYIVLRGRVLTYYVLDEKTGGAGKIRGQLELSKFTRIKVCDFASNGQWGFEIHPQNSKKHGDMFRISGHREDEQTDDRGSSLFDGRRCQYSTWQLVASSRVQREDWIRSLITSVRLIERVEEPAKLRGLGSVFDHFKVGKILGRGRFGVVRECTHFKSHEKFALKIINKTKNATGGKAAMRTVRNELKVLRRIRFMIKRHPYICSTFEFYEDRFITVIVMEFLGGGDLFDRIVKLGKYTERDTSIVIRRLLEALRALHKAGIVRSVRITHIHIIRKSHRTTSTQVHRDMKPENVLFATTNRDAHDVKIADFGCALIQSRRRKKSSYSTMTSERNIVGTPGYIAPEVLTATPRYSSKCDVWACGVILYIMLVGYPPIHGRNEWEVFSRTRKGAFKFYEQDWVGISSKARKLVQRMLQVDLKKRCSVQQALKDSWFSTSSETELPLTQIRLETLNRKMKEKEVDAEESSSKEEGENKEEKDVTLTTNTSSTTKPMLIPSRRSRGRSKGSSGGSKSPIRTPGSLTYTDAEIEAIRNSSKKRLSHWKRERAIQRSNELDKIKEENGEDVAADDNKSSKISKKKKKSSFVTRNKRLKSF